ncbi:hypothetical protein BC939DRAFT_128947 [Gamsiella multidivaricata]|uniref:uncharacterized protein n=1 Tax=Gamsiella multidivaricata TaxID=101098 RepID=UPI00221F3B9D|nr:uncharacterized protein BC939DRAFT_128947 [Gamsiella multidivaricata]KAI7825364.1 hypothetical protein BC939DRAFT_128947 [Gamsiella multidivaricata]
MVSPGQKGSTPTSGAPVSASLLPISTSSVASSSNAGRSNPLPRRSLVPEALLSPTIDFPKPRSMNRTHPSDSLNSPTSFHMKSSMMVRHNAMSDQQESSGSDDEEDVIAKSKKDVPLAAQAWRLYSLAKDSLPNAQRLENLTWRLMSMTLHKNSDSRQSLAVADAASGPPRLQLGRGL